MRKILNLEDFAIDRLHYETWYDQPEEDSDPAGPNVRYEVFRNDTDPSQYMLELEVKLSVPVENDRLGYCFSAQITGFFRFAEDATEEEMQYLIRVNGGTILYGILRGQMAALATPLGKILLPTVYMNEIVRETEGLAPEPGAKGSAAAISARPKKSARKKSASATKKATRKKT
ncbi:hypothetical protein HQ520_06830 [bacterium]|nr:hypothetical protein [bacterium]